MVVNQSEVLRLPAGVADPAEGICLVPQHLAADGRAGTATVTGVQSFSSRT